jgi:hypothetical protein
MKNRNASHIAMGEYPRVSSSDTLWLTEFIFEAGIFPND